MVRKSFEEKLSRLKELGEGPCSDEAVREIRRALAGANGILAAEAARDVAKLNLGDLVPEIIDAYYRFLENPVKRDPGCHAKITAVEALTTLEWNEADVFLHGIRHVQMEPSYGPPVDTAARLRSCCAFGLYRMGHPELPFETVSLLMDREPEARTAAIQILTELGGEWCALLLRMKALQGDERTDIIGDCFNGLMAIDPGRSLGFVGRFLSAGDPGIAEEAALAVGNSRLKEAYPLLSNLRGERAGSAFKRMLLLPIGLTRCEDAFDYLLDVVENEHREYAAAAIEALTVYGHNSEHLERIRRAVSTRNESAVSDAFNAAFH